VRDLLSDFFFWLAKRAQLRAERSTSAVWKIRYRRRSEFYSDVECWLAGLGTWKQLRRRRHGRPIRPGNLKGAGWRA
jgi:hypothetical protein